ncbi:MAG: Aldehyde Dehydrogenase, partial [Verrucomicrobiales bacterium]|nr:Aldehyde Dehydrogenase [Verrucomicrobiales bacterium]
VVEKITYASLGSLGEEFHQQFDAALNRITDRFGLLHTLDVAGKALKGRPTFTDVSPSNNRIVLGTFQNATRADTQKVIDSAKAAFPGWRDLGWRKRVEFLRKAAELMTERQFEYAAWLVLEVGKNRVEAIAEVSEAIDLILYYCAQIEEHGGYEIEMSGSGKERTKSVLKPYGAWAVIAPFNFPLALGTGMAAGALVAGNTVVFKPASATPMSGILLAECMHDAGLPEGVFNLVTGAGNVVGEELVANATLDGLVFTGSRAVGLQILRRFGNGVPKPCIVEMGGKNPAIIMPSANIEDATEGVVRSAFGMGGQKCSACSRLYLHKTIYRRFMDLLVEKTAALKIADPSERDTFLGPMINHDAFKKYDRAVRTGKKEGRLVYGGERMKGRPYAHACYVQPAIFDRLPKQSVMFRDEFFAPILAVREFSTLDEAIALSNDTVYGLTAGIFTQDVGERDKFFNEIEAGVLYCNRRGGATTGAWPGVQSFGGWKSSGSSGKSALGPYYVSQFLREQSQTTFEK